MNIQRAKEIVESPDMKKVTYNGVPIYIQHVNEELEQQEFIRLTNLKRSMKCS